MEVVREMWSIVEISRAGCSRTGDSRQADRTEPSPLLASQVSGSTPRAPPGRLTPLLWVDWMDCSLADEHVLMRSASLLCVECLWLWLPDPEPAWIWFWF